MRAFVGARLRIIVKVSSAFAHQTPAQGVWLAPRRPGSHVHLPDVADISHITASGFGLGHRQHPGREPDFLPNPASLLRKITLAWRPS